MSPSKKTEPVEEGVKFVTIRGKTYRIDELSQKKYEELQRMAEVPDEKNEGSTTTDMLLLERLTTLEAVTVVDKAGDPPGEKLNADEWGNEKFSVTSRIGLEVRRAHYMALTDDEMADSKKSSPNA